MVSILLGSCPLSTSSSGETLESTRILKTVPSQSRDFGDSYWKIVDQQSSAENGSPAIIYAMKTSGGRTLIYCFTDSDLSDVFNQPGVMIQLGDNIDEANLLSNTNLYSLGDIKFWVMKFEARTFNSNKIYLYIGKNDGSVF